MPSAWLQLLQGMISTDGAATDGTPSAETSLCLQRARIALRRLERSPECFAIASDSLARARRLLKAAELSALRWSGGAGDAKTTYYSELAERQARQTADLVLRSRRKTVGPPR